MSARQNQRLKKLVIWALIASRREDGLVICTPPLAADAFGLTLCSG